MKRTAEARLSLLAGFHVRHDLHLARKAWHISMGCVILYFYLSGVSQPVALGVLGAVLACSLVLEGLRLKTPSLNRTLIRCWGPLMRSHELRQMTTAPHYLSSVFLAIAIFPKPVAVLSIFYLACGDPVASIAGILYGHKGPRIKPGKTLVGSLAGVITCSLITAIYLSVLGFQESTLCILSLIGGLAGGLAELLPFDIDDNFTIPILSGFILWLSFMILGV